MKILFVARKFPPSTGGMENAAYELYTALARDHQVTLVKWGGANKALPVIYPWLMLVALVKGLVHRPNVIYLQDGLMAPMGLVLRFVLRRPTVMTIHGLEVTFSNPLYRKIVLPAIARQSSLVAVSSETKQKVIRVLPRTSPTVIFNGTTDNFYSSSKRAELFETIARGTDLPIETLQTSKLLYTSGRLIKRKGVRWFIEAVLPKLVAGDSSIHYLVSGTGKEKEAIEASIALAGMQDHVSLLGRVSDEVLHALYNACDIFVMPNIPVLNDMEGFGLVAIEAASCGATVVAADLEGIKDAIINGQNGFVAKPQDADSFVRIIKRELATRTLTRASIRKYTLRQYSWTETAHQYAELMATTKR